MATETTEQIIERFKNEETKYGMYKHEYLSTLFEENIEDGEFDWENIYDDAEEHGLSKEEVDLWWSTQQLHSNELAALGAEYLDKNYPHWRDEVDEERLKMASGYSCILGQMFGEYTTGIRAIYNEHAGEEGAPPDNDTSGEWPRDHGFIDNGACYSALDIAWQRELRG